MLMVIRRCRRHPLASIEAVLARGVILYNNIILFLFAHHVERKVHGPAEAFNERRVVREDVPALEGDDDPRCDDCQRDGDRYIDGERPECARINFAHVHAENTLRVMRLTQAI